MSDPIQRWIADHRGPDWAVVIIGPYLDLMFISENLVFRTLLAGRYSLAGIHVRDLLVVADLDAEDWMPDLVASLTAGANAVHVPYTTPEESP